MGDLGTEENYDPAYLEPTKKKRNGSETPVDGAMTCDPDLKFEINELDNLKAGTGDDPRQQAGTNRNLGVWHNYVEHDEKRPYRNVG